MPDTSNILGETKCVEKFESALHIWLDSHEIYLKMKMWNVPHDYMLNWKRIDYKWEKTITISCF